MKIKRLIILLTVISLVVAGCQRIEKAGSDMESTLKESVDVSEEFTEEAETGSDFAEAGSENAETGSKNAETGRENAETGSGTPDPDSTLGSEQGTKEEQQSEAGQQTGPETETTPEEKPIELVYELEPNQENYLFSIRKQSIVKDGDSYRMTGMKLYKGRIVLNWEQKALLDAGAELKVMYEGKEIDRIKAELIRQYSQTVRTDIVRYVNKNRFVMYAQVVTSDMKNEKESDEYIYERRHILPYVDLDDPRYGGVGFYFTVDIARSQYFLFLRLEENVTLEIPADMEFWRYRPYSSEISPDENAEICTFAEYYEDAYAAQLHELYGRVFEIQEEEGEVVRMIELNEQWRSD